MLSKLKHFDGAKPGKKLKRKSAPTDADEIKTKRKTYEENKRKRHFKKHWQIGRKWLAVDEVGDQNTENDAIVMRCITCQSYWGPKIESLKPESKKWVTGTSNFKLDTIKSHESSKMHKMANEHVKEHLKPIQESNACKALFQMKSSDYQQMTYKFRNVHAIAKWDMSFKCYSRLCRLDRAKGLAVNKVYENDKSARIFTRMIAETEINKQHELLEKAKCFSITIDGCADTSGTEQESIYLHVCDKGIMHQRFLCFKSPKTTCSQDIYEAVLEAFTEFSIDSNKLIGITCDGASNMLGIRKGLATLLKNLNPDLVVIHCLAHRLELAIKYSFKKSKLYEKSMTLLIGIYYHYKKSSKQRKELERSFESLNETVIFPTRVGGTRWVPHTVTALTAFFKGYKALMMQLENSSHNNPKSEGLYNIGIGMELVAYLLVVRDILQPIHNLSLFLQKEETTLGDASMLLLCTRETILHYTEKDRSEELAELLNTGMFKGVQLKQRGAKPELKYVGGLTDSIAGNLEEKFSVDKDFFRATTIANLKLWPSHKDEAAIHGYGDEGVGFILKKFPKRFEETTSIMQEWGMLKTLLYIRYSENVQRLTWSEINTALTDQGVDKILSLIDFILSLPATSVHNERCFSHMKIMKTDRRSRMTSSTMTDVLLVKLETPDIEKFDPQSAINLWTITPSGRTRRPNFKRRSKSVPNAASSTTTKESERIAKSDPNFKENNNTVCLTDDIAVMPESAAASAGEPTTQPQNLVTESVTLKPQLGPGVFENSAQSQSESDDSDSDNEQSYNENQTKIMFYSK